MKRRAVLQLMSGVGVGLIGCGDDEASSGACEGFVAGQTVVTRKGASQMSAAEIERFTRAWDLLADNGTLSKFAVGHASVTDQRHHGVQILGDYTAAPQPPSYAQRFLCWHRAYVLDLEQAMRAVLVADYQARGLDCAEADLVFVPYFDGSSYPDWLNQWMPTGTPTGAIVAHADDRITPDCGHESNGLALGETYEVVMRAYEGTTKTCPTAPPHSRLISEALANEDFTTFSGLLETVPGIIFDTPDPALADMVRLASEDIVDKDGANQATYDSFQLIAAIIEAGGWLSQEVTERFGVVTALTAIDRGRGFDEYGIQSWTDAQYDAVVSAINTYIQRSPHAVLHFYSAGESDNPDELGLYGSSAFVADAGADPHFYMLHCELDRYFATWIASNTDMPQVEGEDRIFKTWEDAREWTVDELMDQQNLPFAYDELWSPA